MLSLKHAKDGLVPGDYLTSSFSVYRVHSILGSGTYGKVAKCTRMKDMKTVAIKIMKQKLDVSYEVEALKKIKSLDPDKCNLVRWYNIFKDKEKFCLEFEHLDKSLLDFMTGRNHPIFLKEIRPIVQQLANALSHLKTVGIVHADLKLENVMFVNQVREPYRVKVIDFGLSVEVSAAEVGLNIQTYPYRSPEIILGLPFTEAIDMWSLGCIAATLYLGTLLYPGNNEYEVIRYIVKTQGQPPDTMLSDGQKTGKYFQEDVSSTTTFWKLKTPEQVCREMGIKAKKSKVLKFASLDDLKHILDFQSVSSADKVVEKTDRLAFVDMLKGMLQLDAAKRMTPSEVLDHDFLSMHHIASMYHHSNHVRACFQIMDICKKKVPNIEACKTVNGSIQPLSRTAKRGSSWAVRSSMVQPHSINSHPCTNIQTTGSHSSGIKGKTDDKNVPPQVTFLAAKSSLQESCADSSISNSKAGSVSHRRQLDQCHVSDSNYNWLAHKLKRASDHSVGLSTSNCRSQRCVSSEFKRGLDLCHIYDSFYTLPAPNKKRTSECAVGLSTSNYRGWAHNCVSSVVKTRLDHWQNPKYIHNWSAHKEKRASECSADVATSSYRNPTWGCVSSAVKARLDLCHIPKSIHNCSSAHNEKKSTVCSAGLSTSNGGSQTRSYVSAVKGRLIQCQFPKSIYNRSAHKENRTTDHAADLSTSNYRSWAQNCVSSEIKRRLAHPVPESINKWTAYNEKKVSDRSPHLSTSKYKSWALNSVSSEIKKRLDCQLPKYIYMWSSYKGKRASDDSVG